MSRARIGLALALLGAAAACAVERGEAGAEAPSTAAASTEVTPGPTTFDRAIGARPDRLPATFRGLVDLVARRTRGATSVTFVPKGRSLVRDATTLADPRVVVAVHTAEPERLGATDVDAHRTGVFLGFARTTGTVEVISYDERAGRYEFELVEDFGVPGRTPRVRRAERDLCLGCHKLGTPIFPVGLWSETLDHNPRLLEASRRAMNGGTTYEGFDLPEEAIEDFVHPGQTLEDAATTAHKRLVANDLWEKTCGASAACRASLLKFAFYTAGELWNHGGPARRDDWPGYAEARADFTARVRATRGAAITYGRPVITDRDPLATPAITPDTDPLLLEQGIGGIYRDEPSTDFLAVATSFELVGGVFHDADMVRVRAHVARQPGATLVERMEHLARGWADRPWAQTAGPLRRCAVLADVLEGAAVPGCGGVDDDALVAPAPDRAIGDDDVELAPFRAHCGGCHAGGLEPAFLAPPPAGKTARDVFRAWAHCVAPVLAREGTPARTMPPEGSADRRRLDGDDATRARMAGLARVLAEEQRTLAHAGRGLPTGTCPSGD